MNNKKAFYAIIGAAALLIIALIIAVAAGNGKNKGGGQENGAGGKQENPVTENMQQDNAVLQTNKTPEEMRQDIKEDSADIEEACYYFVSKNDAEYDKEMQIIEELKSQYGSKVKFNVIDVDEEPDKVIYSNQSRDIKECLPVFMVADGTAPPMENCVDKDMMAQIIEFSIN